jgi:transcriptional regulator with XRE-family HTH domain
MARNSRRARSLAAVLKDVLKRSRLSEREVAPLLGVSNMTINRWVNGETTPSAEQVASFLTAVGVVGDEKDRVLAIARAPESDWLVSGPAGINPQLAIVMDCERDASRITEWSPLVLPGLLQTSDYARSVISRGSGNLAPQEIKTRVMMRIARRDAITGAKPVDFTALIGLPAIHGGIGGPQVMAEQLRYLTEMAERSNVTIRAFDLGGEWCPAHAGPFILYEFDDMPPQVYLEHHRSGALVVDDQDVAAYQIAVEQMKEMAMSPDRTAGLIADVIPSLERRQHDRTSGARALGEVASQSG